MKVFKYPLRMGPGPQTLNMTPGSILHVHEQADRPILWALASPDAPAVERTFYVHATGEDVTPDARYVGTVHLGWTVWHVFEATP